MTTMTQPVPIAPEKLKPELHLRIERMTEQQLVLLKQILLQLEAEEIAGRLGEAFDQDNAEGRMARIPELIRQFRAKHQYA